MHGRAHEPCVHVGGQGTILEARSFPPPFCGFQDGALVIKFMQQAALAVVGYPPEKTDQTWL